MTKINNYKLNLLDFCYTFFIVTSLPSTLYRLHHNINIILYYIYCKSLIDSKITHFYNSNNKWRRTHKTRSADDRSETVKQTMLHTWSVKWYWRAPRPLYRVITHIGAYISGRLKYYHIIFYNEIVIMIVFGAFGYNFTNIALCYEYALARYYQSLLNSRCSSRKYATQSWRTANARNGIIKKKKKNITTSVYRCYYNTNFAAAECLKILLYRHNTVCIRLVQSCAK